MGVSVEHNREFLEDLEIDELDGLKDLLSAVEKATFGEMVKRYGEMSRKDVEEIQNRFHELGISEDRITEESVNRLEYYLDSFDIKVDESERGVLFSSAKASSFVDRPIVFYIGMDSKWEHKRPEEPWVDHEEFEEENLKNFELLLQNGEQRHFLVRNSEMGNEITPCLYFDEVLDEEFDTFTDLPHERYSVPAGEREEAFRREDYGVEVEPEETISQSSLNKLVKCPREYFFSEVVPMESRDY